MVSIRSIGQRLYSFAASRTFFYSAVGFFVICAAWVAIVSIYPMAFDENFHLGLIQIYAQHWLPFGIPNDPSMAKYGAAAADSSYLYHYLTSFPYRILADLHISQAVVIVLLRLMNVVLFAWTLFVFHKVIRLFGLSWRAANLITAFFVLIPIVPLVAGQINYDNLLLFCTATSLYYALIIIRQIKQSEAPSLINASFFIAFLCIGSATKYAFLPIAVGMFSYVLFYLIRARHSLKTSWKLLTKESLAKKITVGLFFLLAISSLGKFVNDIALYHTPIPGCANVYTPQQCHAYGPYGRNYDYKQRVSPSFKPESIVTYTIEDWLPGMVYRLFFTIGGPTVGYSTEMPAIVPTVIYDLLTIVGLIGFLLFIRSILTTQPLYGMLWLIILLYCGSLIMEVYVSYRETTVPVAVNGRYLLPLVPMIGMILYTGFSKLISKMRSVVSSFGVILCLLIALTGGGVTTYIAAGHDDWFYRGFGQSSEKGMRSILKPLLWQFRPPIHEKSTLTQEKKTPLVALQHNHKSF